MSMPTGSDENAREVVGMSCPVAPSTGTFIRLGHGSGGKMSSDLIENVFLPRLHNPILNGLDDAALLKINNQQIAMTTDSYVVSPIFFPGGDIGSLAVHGTINDLAMRGAQPLYLCAAFILEEGFSIEDLQRIVDSMSAACQQCNVALVAADTKVVGKGAVDKVFITTTGIGIVSAASVPSADRAVEGDTIIVSGDLGRHGVAIMVARENLDIETDIVSDSAAVHELVKELIDSKASIHCMRDITRGGLASILNELAGSSDVGFDIDESKIPIDPQVNAICELLGLDPLYVACEGRFVAIVPDECAEKVLELMKQSPIAKDAAAIGAVVSAHRKRVVLRSSIGGNRILDKLTGEQLPRIC